MNLFKKIFNTPFKKCIITKSFYPMSFMLRIVSLLPSNETTGKTIFIPDALYCIVKKISFNFFSLKIINLPSRKNQESI